MKTTRQPVSNTYGWLFPLSARPTNCFSNFTPLTRRQTGSNGPFLGMVAVGEIGSLGDEFWAHETNARPERPEGPDVKWGEKGSEGSLTSLSVRGAGDPWLWETSFSSPILGEISGRPVGFRGKQALSQRRIWHSRARATGGRIMRFDRRQRETGSVERRFWER